MVNFYSDFVACSKKANVSMVAGEKTYMETYMMWKIKMHCLKKSLFFLDHFDHIKRVIGAESIGIGADFDGAHG